MPNAACAPSGGIVARMRAACGAFAAAWRGQPSPHLSPRIGRPLHVASPAGARARGEASPEGRPRVFGGAQSQVDAFVTSLITGDGCDRWRDTTIWSAYRLWARDEQLEPLPQSIFLGLLAKHAHVKRSRDRVKDDAGRVVKLPSGSPVRSVHYTVTDQPILRSASPRKRRGKAATSPTRVPTTTITRPRLAA